MWEAQPTDAEARALYTGHHDFYDRARLPQPAVVVRPEVGELVVFAASRIHAVRASRGGERLSASCFIGAPKDAGADGGRLVVWS